MRSSAIYRRALFSGPRPLRLHEPAIQDFPFASVDERAVLPTGRPIRRLGWDCRWSSRQQDIIVPAALGKNFRLSAISTHVHW